jgi:membrane-bound metal-dependent hydrolase YbcI (DUF457 family)
LPDVSTHLLIGVSLALLLRRDGPKSEQMLIVIGAVIIDIERPVSWLLAGTPLDWVGLGAGFHSILGAVVLSYFTASLIFLENTPLWTRVGLTLVGCASHLLMDMLMYPWGELGVPLLYPLGTSFSFNLLWPDYPFYPLIGLAFLGLSIIYRQLTISEAPEKSKTVSAGV